MCGIAGIFNIQIQTSELRRKALKMAQKIRHRGPDWSGIYVGGTAILAHERLSIVDPESGGQPLYSPDRKQILAVMGVGERLTIRQIAERLGVADKPQRLKKLREQMHAMREKDLVECVGVGFGKHRRDKIWVRKGNHGTD